MVEVQLDAADRWSRICVLRNMPIRQNWCPEVVLLNERSVVPLRDCVGSCKYLKVVNLPRASPLFPMPPNGRGTSSKFGPSIPLELPLALRMST